MCNKSHRLESVLQILIICTHFPGAKKFFSICFFIKLMGQLSFGFYHFSCFFSYTEKAVYKHTFNKKKYIIVFS